MSTTENNERRVFVIIDGHEMGPYEYPAFVRDAKAGYPGPDELWRFDDETEYRAVRSMWGPPQIQGAVSIPEVLPQAALVREPKSPSLTAIKIFTGSIAFCVAGISLFLLGFVVVFFLVVGVGVKAVKETTDKERNTSASLQNGTSQVRLIRNRYGNSRIEGTVTNITGKTLRYASVEFSVYSVDGSKIDTAVGAITDLGAWQVWQYDLPASPGKSVGRVVLDKVSGMSY